jgi:hypothetical protein
MAQSEIEMFSETLLGRVDQIIDALQGLTDEEISTPPPVPESNSLLVLSVHTMANVEENILEIIGGQRVGRDRDSEFLAAGKSAEELRLQWVELRERLTMFLTSMAPEMLDAEYEHYRRGRITGRNVLLSAAVHAAEHVGHAELTRDWIISRKS